MRIIYTNQVDLTERTGQGTHEKEISALLLNDLNIDGIYIGQKPPQNHEYDDRENAFLLPLKKTFFGYIWYQVRLFMILAKLSRVEDTVIFQRYAPAMIAPALVSFFYKVPMVTRTGPVIRNLGVYGKTTNPLFKIFLNFFIRFNYSVSATLVAVTQTIKDYLLENYGLESEKVRISGNGFNPDTFYLKNDCNQKSRRKKYFVFFAGSFHEDTGIDDLFDAILIAAKKLGGRRECILAGDGPLRAGLQKRYTASKCVWDIKFPGRISQKELNDLSNQSEVGVVPFNNQGLTETGSAAVKVFEYLAAGIPVLATRHADHEFIEINDLGRLCSPDDPNDMAVRLLDFAGGLISYDRDALSQYAINNGTWNKSYESLKNVCKTALFRFRK